MPEKKKNPFHTGTGNKKGSEDSPHGGMPLQKDKRSNKKKYKIKYKKMKLQVLFWIN